MSTEPADELHALADDLARDDDWKIEVGGRFIGPREVRAVCEAIGDVGSAFGRAGRMIGDSFMVCVCGTEFRGPSDTVSAAVREHFRSTGHRVAANPEFRHAVMAQVAARLDATEKET